jgi:hypothetical protein
MTWRWFRVLLAGLSGESRTALAWSDERHRLKHDPKAAERWLLSSLGVDRG